MPKIGQIPCNTFIDQQPCQKKSLSHLTKIRVYMFHKIISDGDQIKKVLLFPGEDMMREQCRAEQQHRESK